MSYYTRLEQGISRGASPEVLDAIAVRCNSIHTNVNTSTVGRRCPAGTPAAAPAAREGERRDA